MIERRSGCKDRRGNVPVAALLKPIQGVGTSEPINSIEVRSDRGVECRTQPLYWPARNDDYGS